MGFKLPPLPRRKNIDMLIEASSLGAPDAKRLRGKTPPRVAREIIRRAGKKNTVACEVDYREAENEEGYEQDQVAVTCSECGHCEVSWGHGEKSVRRCLALMGENCPEDAGNFYI